MHISTKLDYLIDWWYDHEKNTDVQPGKRILIYTEASTKIEKNFKTRLINIALKWSFPYND